MKNALIVEDDPGMALIYRKYIEQLEYNVKVAYTMQDGLDLLEHMASPEIIFLDMNLPDSKGLQTIEHIPAFKKKSPQALIILISGFLSPALSSAALEIGATATQDKHEISDGKDLWNCIKKAANQAPQETQQKLSYTRQLIDKLVGILNLL